MQLKLDNFYGLFTRSSRGTRPVGALDNVENLVFNTKTLKPSLRTGYIKDLTAVPTEVSGQFVMASFRYPRGAQPATEVPTAQNITILCGTDGSSGKHYLQKPYWGNNAGTINSSTWMKWGEYDVIDVTDIPPTTAANALDYQGAYGAGNNYFGGWIICNFTRSEFLYVTGNTDTGGAAGNRSGTLTCLDDIPSDWTAADQYVLYRSFHDNPYDPTLNNTGFNPSWTDPIALKVGNNIIASGGQGSTVGYKPIWSGIVNSSWFSGAARTPSMNVTYVSELELKNTGTWLNPQNVTDAGGGTLTPGKRYWIGLVWESFDGQRSTLFNPSTAYIDAADPIASKLSCSVRIDFHKMDKRCRYLHVFMAETTSSITAASQIDYTDWFFVSTHDLTSTGWAYNAAGAAPGYYSKTVTLDLPDWNNVDTATGDLETFLGHTKANRTIVSFSYGLVTAGRLFVSHYYDYNAALNYNDQVNFTPFAGNGVSQYAKLLDLDDQLQSSIESGDPSSIKGLAVWNSQLVVLKDTGSFSINITSDPTSWILDDISRKIGCDAPDSVVVTPQGVIWAKSGDGVYLWRNGDPIEISRNWRVASDDGTTNVGFRGLATTYASQWQACYDAFYRSYKLVYSPDGSAFTTVYEAFLDVQDEKLGGLPIWTKHILTHNAKHLLVRSDNQIFFATGATASYQLSSTATQDGETTAGAGDGTAIRPYFHTGLYALTESDIATISDFTLSVYQSGSLEGSRQLDMIIYIDGSAQKTWANKTGTATRFNSRLPILGTSNRNRNGGTVAFEFNSQANRRGLGTSYRIEELLINYEVKKRAFSQSL